MYFGCGDEELPPSWVEIELCSGKPYFAAGARVEALPEGAARETTLTYVAREVREQGLTSITIRSRCKLTTELVRYYCSAFAEAGIRVERVIMPKSGPSTNSERTCAAPDVPVDR